MIIRLYTGRTDSPTSKTSLSPGQRTTTAGSREALSQQERAWGRRELSEGWTVQHRGVDFARNELTIP